MPLLDRQARETAIGEIRIGTSRPGAKGRVPVKLDRLRFTSRSRAAIEAIAAMYGGTAREWTVDAGASAPGQWEVITHAAEIPVGVPPGERMLTQDYEWWVKGVRKLLCDGQTERLRGTQPCVCAASGRDRVCRPTSRLRVILPDVPGGGVWMLTTRGGNAADELAGVAETLQRFADRGTVLPAVLRLEQRRTLTDDGVKDYPVPVLQLTQTVRELTQVAAGTVALPPAPVAAIEAPKRAATPQAPPAVPQTPAEPAGWQRPTDPEHLTRLIEASPAGDPAWLPWVRDAAARAGWLDEWVSSRYADEMTTVRDVLDYRADELAGS